MYRFMVIVLAINFVILIDGCASGPPEPVLPDGSHRVPVNPAPPVPDAPAAPNLPVSPDAGDRS